ncbi:MAG: DUF192 domain-containing protein [Firmicutes bacterium]|nr:DUF192 domain-containing protein [Bacillota bacterium]MDD4708295.1 DUF192 domain-containing protein [Bacillota bacterium]
MLKNSETGAVIATDVFIADRFWPKFWGLQFRKSIPDDFACIILGCNSIHTCFMRFDLDAVFVDREWRVLKVYRGLRPFRVIPVVKGAHAVIELKSGIRCIKPGQVLELKIG